jgi:hypothetical protein
VYESTDTIIAQRHRGGGLHAVPSLISSAHLLLAWCGLADRTMQSDGNCPRYLSFYLFHHAGSVLRGKENNTSSKRAWGTVKSRFSSFVKSMDAMAQGDEGGRGVTFGGTSACDDCSHVCLAFFRRLVRLSDTVFGMSELRSRSGRGVTDRNTSK